jgi:hypothetical protein
VQGLVLLAMLAAVASAPGATGCAKQEPVRLGSPERTYERKDYDKVLARWTRRGLILNSLDQALEVYATVLSPDFRAAYAARYIADYKLPPGEAERYRGQIMHQAFTHNEVFLTAAAGRYAWNDLEKKESLWRVALLTDRGVEVSPTKIKAHKIPVDPRAMAFFPHADAWSKAYRIEFPVTSADGAAVLAPGLRWFALRVSGPLGHTELRWLVK